MKVEALGNNPTNTSSSECSAQGKSSTTNSGTKVAFRTPLKDGKLIEKCLIKIIMLSEFLVLVKTLKVIFETLLKFQIPILENHTKHL